MWGKEVKYPVYLFAISLWLAGTFWLFDRMGAARFFGWLALSSVWAFLAIWAVRGPSCDSEESC